MGTTIKIVNIKTRTSEATVEDLQQNFRILRNRGQVTTAITAATEIAVANGQTTNKHPMAINEPNSIRTMISTRSRKDGNRTTNVSTMN